MALRDQPYFPLYVQDFLTDEKLNCCSASTQGVYIKILCILHKQDEYGCILFKQKDKQTDDKLRNFALKFAKLLPFDSNTIYDALIELVDENVLIIEGDKLYQKRMVKDGQISMSRSIAGKTGGGNPILFKQKDKQKDKQNTEDEIEDGIEFIDSSGTNSSSSIITTGEKFDYSILKGNHQRIESWYRATVTANGLTVDFDRFTSLLDKFCQRQESLAKPYKNINDYVDHFVNWVEIQVKKPENQKERRRMP